jgi:hypothetical protein
LEKVVAEVTQEGEVNDLTLLGREGVIAANLQVGADLLSVEKLQSNVGVAVKGFELGSQGFLIEEAIAKDLLAANPSLGAVLHRYQNGKDLAIGKCDRYVIDFHRLSLEQAEAYPELFNHLLVNVKPERTSNREARTASNWWLFRRSGQELRNATAGLEKFIATTRTAKFRIFQFIDAGVRAESKIVAICSEESFHLAILSSTVHIVFATSVGGWLGVGNDPTYNHNDCFETFPFPALEEGPLKTQLRELGERLDAHRKRQQTLHPNLTLTGMYNVLEKLRAGEALNAKEKEIHDQGLITLLKQIHDEIDQAVLLAYGWEDLRRHDTLVVRSSGRVSSAHDTSSAHDKSVVPPSTDETFEQELLTRLVALNHERAAEEKHGLVRWLRPEYQNAAGTRAETTEQGELAIDGGGSAEGTPETPGATILTWPEKLPEQVAAIRKLLPIHGPDPAALSTAFGRPAKKRQDQIEGILETLRDLGM